jgi:hypothetical protein
MESLAVVILGIILGIGVVVFVPLLLLWRKLLRTRFPNVHQAWWVLWVPILLVASFYIALLILRIVILIGG